MKNSHIVSLMVIVVSITVLASFMGSLSTYDTVQSAKKKPGQFVHLIARLDHNMPIEYDAVENPNYLSFTAVDSLGTAIKIVYHNAKPGNLETSERLVLKGVITADHFECQEILMKCPSKYKDDMKEAEKRLPGIQ